MKLWAPEISLTLIESNQKKATFVREVTRALTLTGVNIQNERAEDVGTKFDFVTLRAVERFEDMLPIAAGLLAASGRIVLLISAAQVSKAISVLQLNWQSPVPVPRSKSRVIMIGERGI